MQPDCIDKMASAYQKRDYNDTQGCRIICTYMSLAMAKIQPHFHFVGDILSFLFRQTRLKAPYEQNENCDLGKSQ
jgi:hypothetical protein